MPILEVTTRAGDREKLKKGVPKIESNHPKNAFVVH